MYIGNAMLPTIKSAMAKFNRRILLLLRKSLFIVKTKTANTLAQIMPTAVRLYVMHHKITP